MLLYQDYTNEILGACMEVHNQLGHGYLEAVYQEALEREFILRGIPYEREKTVNIYYKGVLLDHCYRVDFLCFNEIVVELKSASSFCPSHKAQVINYLKSLDKTIGLLVNFNKERLTWDRISFFH